MASSRAAKRLTPSKVEKSKFIFSIFRTALRHTSALIIKMSSSGIKTNADKFVSTLFLHFIDRDAGHLIASSKADTTSHTSKLLHDADDRTAMNLSLSAINLHSNSINGEFLMEPNVNKTFFRSINNTIIVSQVGSIVQIPCRVHLIGDEMVKRIDVEAFLTNLSFVPFTIAS